MSSGHVPAVSGNTIKRFIAVCVAMEPDKSKLDLLLTLTKCFAQDCDNVK